MQGIGPSHFINHRNNKRTQTIMAKLDQDDYNNIAAAVSEKQKHVGGKASGATVTKDYAKQTHTQTLADGTQRVDHQYVEPPKSK